MNRPRPLRGALGALTAAGGRVPAVSEIRVARPQRPLTDRWRQLPVADRGAALLGVSYRPLQAQALELAPRAALAALLRYPFELIRLAAYWDRMEPAPGVFDPAELDWQVDAAERAGRQVIICLGPVKAFGYPEFFVPAHHLPRPLPEGSLVTPATHPALLRAGTGFITQVVNRYRDRACVAAWQVEHDAVDPLGVEHSWRLSVSWVAAEVTAVRAADPGRPVLMNGFLPTSALVRASQWWRSRDQGDSLVAARQLADIVGADFYPRHALVRAGSRTVYLDGSRRPWQQRGWRQVLAWAAADPARRVMIAEGQAEPWEAVTVPPSLPGSGMYSCLPEHVIGNYNQAMRSCGPAAVPCAYLFWGAVYCLLRLQQGDPRYLGAAARVLAES